MRHYEIVFLTHPNQAEQVSDMVERYRTMVEADEGKVHRLEKWGMRKLAFPIKQAYKASYVLMNIECSEKILKEITDLFRFNDAIIRHLIIQRDTAITEPSAILQSEEDEDQEEKTYTSRRHTSESKPSSDKATELSAAELEPKATEIPVTEIEPKVEEGEIHNET